MRVVMGMTVAVLLCACGPGDTRKIDPAAATAPVAPAGMQQTFASCTWGEVKSATASIWAYACGPAFGNVRLEADDALPGFVIASGDAAAPAKSVAIRFFDKPADAPIEAILPAVRAASPGPQTATCVFAPAAGVDHEGKPHVSFQPAGEAKAAYDLALQGDEIPDPPCGALGVSAAGDRIFTVVSPEKVAFIEFGSEIQIFDATTLKVDAAH